MQNLIKREDNFSKELVTGMKNTKRKYEPNELGTYTSIEDGVYDVKFEDVKFRLSKALNNLLILESSNLKTGEIINSLFVLNEDLQQLNFQKLRNLLFIVGEEDFTDDEIEDKNKFLRKINEIIGHKVKLELRTTSSGFQVTDFIDTLDNVGTY